MRDRLSNKYFGDVIAKMKKINFSVLNSFLIGAGIGAVVALLFAPKSGKELRGNISDTALRGVDYTKSGLNQVKESAAQLYTAGYDKAADLVTDSRDLIVEQKDRLSTALDAGKKA